MRYKRNEAFRFEFSTPLAGRFRINQVGNRKVSSSPGDVSILDISPGGMKLATPLYIPGDAGDIHIVVFFTLNGTTHQISGTIVWNQKRLGKWQYGISFEIDEAKQQTLLNDLKAVARESKA